MVSLEERKELLNLIFAEGNRKEFTHKGYECLINRVENRWHLCGYIKYTPESKTEWNIFNEKFHCGVTYDNYDNGWLGEEWIGFDCMHLDDKTPYDVLFAEKLVPTWEGAEYRTMEYVESCLKKAINELENYKSNQCDKL